MIFSSPRLSAQCRRTYSFIIIRVKVNRSAFNEGVPTCGSRVVVFFSSAFGQKTRGRLTPISLYVFLLLGRGQRSNRQTPFSSFSFFFSFFLFPRSVQHNQQQRRSFFGRSGSLGCCSFYMWNHRSATGSIHKNLKIHLQVIRFNSCRWSLSAQFPSPLCTDRLLLLLFLPPPPRLLFRSNRPERESAGPRASPPPNTKLTHMKYIFFFLQNKRKITLGFLWALL